MKVQIYTMQSVEEALQVAALGVDHLGLTPSQIGLPGEIDFWTAREIVETIDVAAVCVALTVETEEKEIIRMARAVQPDILHLCSLENTFPPADVRRLRDKLPDLPLMQAISMTGPQALEAAYAYKGVADYLILDTQAPDIAGIGASGETHDWNVSREIVREVGLPVILAGGLSPENVARAIAEVDPWGVDSLTHTNQALPGGGFKKDLNKIKAFLQAARGSE
jgi:phosphoribosylanthranilate isomerase